MGPFSGAWLRPRQVLLQNVGAGILFSSRFWLSLFSEYSSPQRRRVRPATRMPSRTPTRARVRRRQFTAAADLEISAKMP